MDVFCYSNSCFYVCHWQRAALENMSKVLKAAGSGLEHIVKANVYLKHMDEDFAKMNEVYLEASH